MAITEPSLVFTAALIVLAYLIGSVPFAVVVSKLMGLQDPRSYGSKNPGATNVLRTGNKTAAALTLLGDAAKGWFAIWLAERLAPGIAPTGLALVALAAFVGHLYPIFLGFKGGKGVATALGVLVAIQPWLAVATAATWLI
ncbi:MAG: glycerol-3-phosphate 1-O-acyltransferase PlsY, partial [Achromobacter marplatensis]